MQPMIKIAILAFALLGSCWMQTAYAQLDPTSQDVDWLEALQSTDPGASPGDAPPTGFDLTFEINQLSGFFDSTTNTIDIIFSYFDNDNTNDMGTSAVDPSDSDPLDMDIGFQLRSFQLGGTTIPSTDISFTPLVQPGDVFSWGTSGGLESLDTDRGDKWKSDAERGDDDQLDSAEVRVSLRNISPTLALQKLEIDARWVLEDGPSGNADAELVNARAVPEPSVILLTVQLLVAVLLISWRSRRRYLGSHTPSAVRSR